MGGGRTVVLGVCGGIAAYKSVELCRRLVDAGHHVAVVMTGSARHFVGPMTFSALSSEPVATTLWDVSDPLAHTHLAARADAVVVAPATADFLARYRSGQAGEMLTATLLATTAPVVVCPAMHAQMWEHPATRENIDVLRARGVTVVEPGVGHLAGGDTGPGRLAPTEEILAAVEAVLAGGAGYADDLRGVTVLVTAGGTREPIDPVRFLGNRSSGKQGHAIASECWARGASVTLVTTSDVPVEGAGRGVDVVRVETAQEMADAVGPRAPEADVVVMAAAVADFRPVTVLGEKHPKAAGPPEIALVPTVDILAGIGERKRPGQVVVGFAAETPGDAGDEGIVERARTKMAAKGADLLVVNDVARPGAGFQHDTNAVWILGSDGFVSEVPLSEKRKVAHVVVDAVVDRLRRAGPPGTGSVATR